MIRSMTGYGRGEQSGKISWVVEIRSVNHRFLEIFVKLPRAWLLMEEKIKSFIKGRISRGRVDVFVNMSCENLPMNIKFDKSAVRNYYNKLMEIKQETGFEGPVSLPLLSMMPDLFSIEEEMPQEQELWEMLKPALDQAVKNLIIMREMEGQTLWNDIIARLDIIDEKVDFISKRTDAVIEEYRKRLVQNVERVLKDISLERDRIEAEVVLFAERSNITEELVRLKSHIGQMRNLEQVDDSVGKKADFIIQEMYREANTIASKSPDYDISMRIIEIKSELEKIREQVQNIE
ncbi:MAG TPA: YicC family protein [Thermoanaerobacterales bacterium]|nr:YicC family protein [Thermoanaerobacterales bacterium]